MSPGSVVSGVTATPCPITLPMFTLFVIGTFGL
jgi:hypothetical protein